MSPDVLTSAAALPIPGVVLIGFLLWVGVYRAVRVLGLSLDDRRPFLVGSAALVSTWLVLAFWLGARGFFQGSSTEALPPVSFGLAVPLLVALADLAVGVATGVLAAPGRFPQLAFDAPTSLITAFPLVLIPAFLVPVSVLLHVLSLTRLRSAPARQLVAA